MSKEYGYRFDRAHAEQVLADAQRRYRDVVAGNDPSTVNDAANRPTHDDGCRCGKRGPHNVCAPIITRRGSLDGAA